MLLRDFSWAWRKTLRRPGPAVLAVISLALAIGFSTAAFSVVDAYYWRDLPLANPERLAEAGVRDREGHYDGFTWPEFQAIQRQAGAISGIVVQNRQQPVVKLPDRDDFPIAAGVSDNFFDVLGVQAARGRVFHTGAGGDGQVVITDRYWRTAFAADPSLCGRMIHVGGAGLTVIGIAPPGFQGTERGLNVDLFVPQQTMFGALRMASAVDTKDSQYESLLRLKPGATVEAARIQIETALRGVESAGLAKDPGRKAWASRYDRPEGKKEATAGDIFPWIALLVLTIAAANFANLRLIDSQAQRRETGMRLALGAGRATLLRQHISESLLLSGLATALGLLLASWIIDLAPRLLYAGQRFSEYFIRLDARAFLFSAGAMTLVAAGGTFAPLREAWRTDVIAAIRAASSPGAKRWLTGLVVFQMALITAVADSTGLLWRSLHNVAAIRPAMDPNRRALLVEGSWDVESKLIANRAERVAAELRSIPEVVGVTYCRRLMLAGSGGGSRTSFERPGESKLTFRYTQVSPTYFETTGARVVRGRAFSDRDGPEATLVASVSEAFARKFFGGRETLGQWARIGGKDRQIVGVVEDGPSGHLKEPIEPFVYFPFAQRPSGETTYFLQTAGDPGRIAGIVRDRIRKTDAAYVFSDVFTLSQHLRSQRRDEELAADVSGGLALLCLVLAAAGTFGVTLYAVTRRMREFGVRVALGATPSVLSAQVMRESLGIALPGVALGWGLALAGHRFLQNRLYGVEPGSIATLAAAGLLVTLLAAAAALVPARRAAQADPMEALRAE
jgi:putative ABC transport system permease protein